MALRAEATLYIGRVAFLISSCIMENFPWNMPVYVHAYQVHQSSVRKYKSCLRTTNFSIFGSSVQCGSCSSQKQEKERQKLWKRTKVGLCGKKSFLVQKGFFSRCNFTRLLLPWLANFEIFPFRKSSTLRQKQQKSSQVPK